MACNTAVNSLSSGVGASVSKDWKSGSANPCTTTRLLADRSLGRCSASLPSFGSSVCFHESSQRMGMIRSAFVRSTCSASLSVSGVMLGRTDVPSFTLEPCSNNARHIAGNLETTTVPRFAP
eukprot:4063280-Amphidinium_carterae.2